MKNVLVLGERAIDKFIYCRATGRTAPDKPIPIIEPIHTRENPGMAANFVANLKHLFPELNVVYVCQNDIITKTRYVDEETNHYYLRIDENDKINEEMTLENLKLILSQNNLNIWDFDCIAVSSYGKGFITKKLVSLLTMYGKVFLDTKDVLDFWSRNVYCVKINGKEYDANVAANSNFSCQNLIVTRGDKGTLYKDIIYPARKVEVTDVSGCGDIMFAGLVGLFLNDLTFEQSIPLCNVLCSLAVSRRGVNILNANDLEMAIKLLNYPL